MPILGNVMQLKYVVNVKNTWLSAQQRSVLKFQHTEMGLL
jgi:hypothetical protein